MTDEMFNKLMHGVVEDIRSMTPKRTRNLAKNATYGRPVAHGKFVIVVDSNIAPYATYVNDYSHHVYRDKGGNLVKGKANKNYHYFQRALVETLKKIGSVEGDA